MLKRLPEKGLIASFWILLRGKRVIKQDPRHSRGGCVCVSIEEHMRLCSLHNRGPCMYACVCVRACGVCVYACGCMHVHYIAGHHECECVHARVCVHVCVGISLYCRMARCNNSSPHFLRVRQNVNTLKSTHD